MPDYTQMNLWCRREDLPKIEGAELYGEYVLTAEELAQPFAELSIPEAIPAQVNDIPNGVPFIAIHEAGEAYGPAMYVYDGMKLVEWPVGHKGQQYLIADLSDTSVEELRGFLAFERKVKVMLGMDPDVVLVDEDSI